MDEPERPPFEKGAWVCRKNDVSAFGQVIDVRWNDQLDEWKVQAVFGEKRISVAAEGLIARPPHRDIWGDLRGLALGSARQFVTLMTYERLKHPPAAIGNALGSARARFYPYQFKPLLKFLDHPSHRLLVADDVGLGKTIEAGYILKEWRARRDVGNVLVVVPARLRTKWQNELNTKFGEAFEIVEARRFRSVLRRVADGGMLEPFAWIGSYESLRGEAIVELVEDLQFPLDMVIFDEAHRARNVGTYQYRLTRALSSAAEAVLFLTATPVQTKLEDLFRLLDMLDPGAYGSESTFREILESNHPIVRAARLAGSGRFQEAMVQLVETGNSPHTVKLFNDPAFVDVFSRLVQIKEPSRADQIRLQREISDFGLYGAVISRTRKSEVVIDRPKRVSQTPTIEMSPAEETIYRAVASAVRLFYPYYSGWGQQMAALMMYRYTASCIPAAAETIGRRWQGADWASVVNAVLGEVEDEDLESPERIEAMGIFTEVEKVLFKALARVPTREEDSKYLRLRRVLVELWAEDNALGRRPRKVVVFATFRGTLTYLERSLEADGVSNRLIQGQIAIPDRENRIAEFLETQDVNVLLASEVGGEGLDLQAASVIVNYDLPWNPMVVEQRIGRVDRIGQLCPVVNIVNLVLDRTVEQRIVARLYDRIELFEESIGEIDEILGEQVQDLVIQALSGELTEEQQEERTLRTADALLRQMKDVETMDARTDDLISADQAMLEEIEQLREKKRVPEPREVKTLLLQFLEARYPGVRLEGDTLTGVGSLTLPAGFRKAFLEWAGTDTDARRWAGRLGTGVLTVTFDPDVALRSGARVELLHPKHALVQYAIHRLTVEIRKQGETFGVFVCTDVVPAGTWAVGVWALEIAGSRKERQLAVVAVEVGGPRVFTSEEGENFLVAALEAAQELDPRPTVDAAVMEDAVERLKDHLDAHVAKTTQEGRESEKRRLARRRATWSNTLQRRVDRLREQLERLTRDGRRESVLNMHRGKILKAEAELKAKLEEINTTPAFEVEEQEICAFLLVNQPREDEP